MFIAGEALNQRKYALDPWVTRLALAVLEQAIRDLRSVDGSERARQWKLDAIRWFRSADESAGSFLWVCQVLDRDPEKARATLPRLRG